MTDAPRFPEPSEKPDRDIIIWDGKCNFCRSQVERLRRLDSGKLAYLSLHDPRCQILCPQLTVEQLMEQLWVVTPSGEHYGGADAGRYLSRTLPKLWWLKPLLHIPFTMPCWRWLYRRIASRRYRIAGIQCEDGGTCELHHKGSKQ
jgi:predicted DCC family thiol-disulfide oxidoreductase YuxK